IRARFVWVRAIPCRLGEKIGLSPRSALDVRHQCVTAVSHALRCTNEYGTQTSGGSTAARLYTAGHHRAPGWWLKLCGAFLIEDTSMDVRSGANTKSGSLTLGDKSFAFPVYEGTIGPDVIDISKLYGQANIFTYDPGYTSTASCESKITYIDGDEGILLYRGYPIEQLAEHGDFLETCYLLLYGELPNAKQKQEFDYLVTRHTMVHEQMSRFYQGFRRDAHPMAVMVGSVGALSAFYHDSTDISDPNQRDIASIRMIAK